MALLEAEEKVLERAVTQSELMGLMIHEQYYCPDCAAYEPHYRERVERAIQWVTRRGYKPVFWEEGFLGTGKPFEDR